MALEAEAPNMAKWENVFFSGVGKVNAALTAGKLIERYQPRTVWNFVTDPNLEIPAHVVDMEAYAIGKACLNQHVDFKCFKYVSDQADEGADEDWLKNIADGEEHYIKIFQQVTGGG